MRTLKVFGKASRNRSSFSKFNPHHDAKGRFSTGGGLSATPADSFYSDLKGLRDAGILKNADGVNENGEPYVLAPSTRTDYIDRGEPMRQGWEQDPNHWSAKDPSSRYIQIRPAGPIPTYNRDDENGLGQLNMKHWYETGNEAMAKDPALSADVKMLESQYIKFDTKQAEKYFTNQAKEANLTGRTFDNYVNAQMERTKIITTTNNDFVRYEIAKRLEPFVPTDKNSGDYFKEFDKSRSVIAGNLEKANPVIAIDGENMLQVIKDGRFKTQYETKNSNGAYMPQTRRTRETAYMGVPLGTPAKERPIYGYIASQESGKTLQTSGYNADKWNVNNHGVGQYGDVRVVLNDNVAHRTTYTIPDSLDGYAIARPLREVHTPATLAAAGLHHDLSLSHGGLQREGYVEAQISGGVKLTDIKSIHLTGRQANDASKEALIGALKEKGLNIPVSILKGENL